MSVGASAKVTKIDEVQNHGKNAVLGAESFAFNQGALASTVEAHTDAIDSLSNNYKSLEQQLKTISRVLASQNVQKLTENLKVVQEDLRRSVLFEVGEKQKEMLNRMEREVQEVTDTKIGIMKKIESVHTHIMDQVAVKFEDAYQMRRANRDEIEKMKETMGEVPAIADKNSKMLKTLEIGFTELKNEFKNFQRRAEIENMEQDKTTAALASEVRTSLEAAKDKIDNETKSMSRAFSKREVLLDEEVKNLKSLLDKEGTVRTNALKGLQGTFNDEMFKLRSDHERRCAALESFVDHKVSPFESSVRELKHLIQEESVHRDTADKELSRCITKECQDRAHDEDRLVSMISTCQNAVTKMHRT